MPATLTPETQAKLDRAFSDKAAANAADDAHTAADQALTLAQAAADQTLAQARTAHATASDSAHAALAAIAVELGFPLPG